MEHRATGLCSLQGRQECLPYLNACRYLCDFRRNAPEGGEREKIGIFTKQSQQVY